MSLLTIAQDVARSVGGIQEFQIAVGNPQASQIVAMIQQVSEDLVTRHDWSALVRFHSFTPVDASLQPDSVPADFHRFAGEPTMWFPSQPISGPLRAGDWATVKANSPVQPFPSWRMMNGAIWFTPRPPLSGDASYEYQSKNFVKHADNTSSDRFVADNDETYLPERLIRLFAIAWWKHAKGFDYAEDLSTAERAFEMIAGTDGGGIQDIVPNGRAYENPLGPRAVNAGALGILSSGGYVGG